MSFLLLRLQWRCPLSCRCAARRRRGRAALGTVWPPLLTPLQTHNTDLVAFFAFEVCCGVYFPSGGTMRSKYVPEEVRATVMNMFRIGLNVRAARASTGE